MMSQLLFLLDDYSASVIITLLIGVVSIAITWMLRTRTRKVADLQTELDSAKKKLTARTKELLALYQDAHALVQIVESLRQECGVSRQESRAGFTLSHRCEPKRIEKRISEIEKQLKYSSNKAEV